MLHKNGVFTALELKVNMIVQKEVAGISRGAVSIYGCIKRMVNDLYHRFYTAIVGWLGVILGRQRRNDYRPKDIDLAAMTVATSVGWLSVLRFFFF